MINLERPTFQEIPETLGPQAWKDHPVTWQKFVKGGFQSFAHMQEADAFPMKRREWGMLANIAGLFHVISDDLKKWNPCEKGYLTLNPNGTSVQYNLIYPWNYRVTGITSHEVVQNVELKDWRANVVQKIFLTGNEDSAITYEILKWYP
jgi:hypothetical protein